MSGSWKAALKASAAAVRPRSQAMYLVLTSPMTREAMTEDMSRSVAVKAVWLWEGRRMARARRQRGGVEVEDIEIDSTGDWPSRRKRFAHPVPIFWLLPVVAEPYYWPGCAKR